RATISSGGRLGDDAVEPGDKVACHLVAVDLVEELMPRVGVEAVADARETGGAVGGEKLLRPFGPGADGIARPRDDVDRQGFRDSRLARRTRDLAQRVEHVDPELRRGGKASKRVGDVFVDLGRIARVPVEFRARRRTGMVNRTEVNAGQERPGPAWTRP